MRRFVLGIVSLTMLAATAGCGGQSGSTGENGDCTAKLRINRIVYAAHQDAVDSATGAGEVGVAEVLGCDSEVVDTVTAQMIEGVAPEIAVVVPQVGESSWPGVYVAEGTDPSDWPTLRKQK